LARLEIVHAAEEARPAAYPLRAAAAGAATFRGVVVVVVDAFRVDQLLHEGDAPQIIRRNAPENTRKTSSDEKHNASQIGGSVSYLQSSSRATEENNRRKPSSFTWIFKYVTRW